MTGKTRTSKKKYKKKSQSKQSVERKLKIFANVVVDRLVEKQANGNLS